MRCLLTGRTTPSLIVLVLVVLVGVVIVVVLVLVVLVLVVLVVVVVVIVVVIVVVLVGIVLVGVIIVVVVVVLVLVVLVGVVLVVVVIVVVLVGVVLVVVVIVVVLVGVVLVVVVIVVVLVLVVIVVLILIVVLVLVVLRLVLLLVFEQLLGQGEVVPGLFVRGVAPESVFVQFDGFGVVLFVHFYSAEVVQYGGALVVLRGVEQGFHPGGLRLGSIPAQVEGVAQVVPTGGIGGVQSDGLGIEGVGTVVFGTFVHPVALFEQVFFGDVLPALTLGRESGRKGKEKNQQGAEYGEKWMFGLHRHAFFKLFF